MYLGGVSVAPDFGKLYQGLAELFKEYSNSDEVTAQVGIFSEGPAAAYANVWEFGNARQRKKGPKTVRGINPDGKTVWLTITAPYGYVRVNILKFWAIIDQELASIDFTQTSGKKIDRQVKQVALNIGTKIAKVVSKTAPFDEGDLSKSIKAYAMISMVDDDD